MPWLPLPRQDHQQCLKMLLRPLGGKVIPTANWRTTQTQPSSLVPFPPPTQPSLVNLLQSPPRVHSHHHASCPGSRAASSQCLCFPSCPDATSLSARSSYSDPSILGLRSRRWLSTRLRIKASFLAWSGRPLWDLDPLCPSQLPHVFPWSLKAHFGLGVLALHVLSARNSCPCNSQGRQLLGSPRLLW